MKFGRSLHPGNEDDIGGNDLQEWLLERMVQRKQKLRDLFMARHSDSELFEEVTSVNWFDALG
jgi:phage antirepressor YoqD-like protein